MSILASLDLHKQEWQFIESAPFEDLVEISIGFSDKVSPVIFDNLSFGLSLFNQTTNKKLLTATYPPKGVNYVSTDQPYMASHNFQLKYGEEIVLNVWAKNAGKTYKDTFFFLVPRPKQPYNSWVWDEKAKLWKAPIPYPSDGNKYYWNEETLSWALSTS